MGGWGDRSAFCVMTLLFAGKGSEGKGGGTALV